MSVSPWIGAELGPAKCRFLALLGMTILSRGATGAEARGVKKLFLACPGKGHSFVAVPRCARLTDETSVATWDLGGAR
jgi:hypothetical protein